MGEVRVPLTNADFTAYTQRAKDANPQAIFAFVNANGGGQAFLKSFYETGLAAAGVKILATPDLVLESFLPAYGDNAAGVISSGNYSANHDFRGSTARSSPRPSSPPTTNEAPPDLQQRRDLRHHERDLPRRRRAEGESSTPTGRWSSCAG